MIADVSQTNFFASLFIEAQRQTTFSAKLVSMRDGNRTNVFRCEAAIRALRSTSDCSAPTSSLANGLVVSSAGDVELGAQPPAAGPHTGRGAKPAGLLDGRTRLLTLFELKIKEPARLL